MILTSSPVDHPSLDRPVLGLTDAVSRFVQDGDAVYLGNFGAQLFCVGHEIVRQSRRRLDLVIASGGILLDQLLGAGVVRSAVFGHCWSPVGPAPAWNFRRSAEAGDHDVELHELSLGLLTAALTAGAWGVPFMPVPGLPGTGYADEDWSAGLLATATSTFGDSPVVRALAADVAFVHADTADGFGNALIRGPVGEALVAAQGAHRVVVVAERVLGPGEQLDPGYTLPGLLVDAVVPRPGAVWPDGVVERYDRDVEAYEAYAAATVTADGFSAWLEDICSAPDPYGRLVDREQGVGHP